MRRWAKKVNEPSVCLNRRRGKEPRGPDQFVLRRDKGHFARASRLSRHHNRVN
jgi:hypothetical protein